MYSGDTWFSKVKKVIHYLWAANKQSKRPNMCHQRSSRLTFGSLHGFGDEPATGLVSLVKHAGGAFQPVGLLQQVHNITFSAPLQTDVMGADSTHHLLSVVLNRTQWAAQCGGDQVHHLLAEEKPFRRRNRNLPFNAHQLQ